MKTTVLLLSITTFSLLVSAVLGTGVAAVQDREPLKDFTSIKLEDFGIKPVEPKKDAKTGFIIGGNNATELIQRLTMLNGKTIAELEKVMRPGASSQEGFLGKDEKLLNVMVADNKYVVEEMGLTHQELAKHLHAMGAVWLWQLEHKQPETEFLYCGRTFKVKGFATRGFQDSPFGDGTRSGSNVTVHNVSNDKKLEFALLVPYMVERYGFYEGKGTRYRVDPRQVIEVLDFIKEKKAKKKKKD